MNLELLILKFNLNIRKLRIKIYVKVPISFGLKPGMSVQLCGPSRHKWRLVTPRHARSDQSNLLGFSEWWQVKTKRVWARFNPRLMVACAVRCSERTVLAFLIIIFVLAFNLSPVFLFSFVCRYLLFVLKDAYTNSETHQFLTYIMPTWISHRCN